MAEFVALSPCLLLRPERPRMHMSCFVEDNKARQRYREQERE